MSRTNTKTLTMMAVLIAMTIILSRFLSINAWNLKIGFTFVPVFVAAYLYGPVVAGIVGAVADFLGAVLFPIGPYFPGFTVTCMLTGVCFGLLLHKKQSSLRVIAATAINQLIFGLLLNTFWISVLYGADFGGIFVTRIVQCAVMMPVEFVCISGLAKVLARHGKELFA